MEITITCIDTPCCENCGEELTRYDDVVYWGGNENLPAGLYHEDCYLAQ
jgi:hypothetical protein